VAMTLTNFPPNTPIQVCLLGYCTEAGTTDSNGGLTSAYEVPAQYAIAGAWTLTASGGDVSDAATLTFH
jgi:hypothetical protein